MKRRTTVATFAMPALLAAALLLTSALAGSRGPASTTLFASATAAQAAPAQAAPPAQAGAPPNAGNTAQGTDGLGASMPAEGAKPHPDRVKLPPGFSIALWAENVKGPRTMTLASDGTVFVGTWNAGGSVYALADRNKDGKADAVITIASGLMSPNGVAFKDGTLYVAENNRIVKFDKVLDAVKPGMALLTPTVVYDKLPADRMHGWKYLHMGPDGYLYFGIGAPCNICDKGDPYASVNRVKPDGTGYEIFARGVRNTVGITFHPVTKEMWFTDNGRDMLGDEAPNDELNVAAKAGLHFGYPYCHEGAILDAEFGKGKSCADYQAPAQKLGPHVAPLGLAFYGGSMFPAEYKNRLFIAQHGSWNRTPTPGHNGYRIMTAKVDGSTVTGYELFAEGWLEADRKAAWGRPVDLLELPDGSLLLSDDRAHAIYRISYKK